MNEIEAKPNGWEIERLGDFVVYQKGKKPKIIDTVQTKKCSLPYVNIKAFEKNIIDEFTDGEGCILCEDGDFLMVWDGARSGYVGKAIKGALGSTLVKITFPGIFIDYAYYFLQSKYLQINTKAKGTGIPHVDPDLLWNYYFPIPPLPEQHRIVAKIEELFSSLDKGIESLKNAQQQLKVYRKAVLKWAFEGKLTNKNVKEGELPKGWKNSSIGSIAKTIDGDRGPNYPKKHEFSDKGYCLFLSTKNVREDRFVFEENIFISKEKDEILRGGKLQIEDVVVTTRGTLGNVALYDEKVPFKNVRINSGMLILRITNPILNNYYLMKFISSPLFSKQLKEKQSGTAQPQIPANVLREIELPIPPTREEQQAIVAEIESRLSVCDKIQESIEESLTQAEALRQSILKKAFEGKLVPQDPSDESASKLLARIKAQTGENSSSKKG